MSNSPKTLFDKVWDSHVVRKINDGPDIFFIDRHFIHEVTSPVAFLGLKNRGISVMFPNKTFATADHNTPTINQHLPVQDPLSANQLKALEDNSAKYGISHWGLNNPKNGIVHVVGPENGITLPGMTIVCGDSHTSTHGAFGAIAFGIGTSEVEMVLSSQCIMQPKPKKMRININGKLGKGVTPKDVPLFILSQITASGATGYFVEFAGEVFENMSMEGRMTVCNLSIEMGARGGMIAPDETTFAYLKGREKAPKGEAWDQAVAYWKTLKTDEGAQFDLELTYNADQIEPQITYGTNPGLGTGISKNIPVASAVKDGEASYKKSLAYMGFAEDEKIIGKPVDYVFLGSCTNG
ncbi:MAG TPA: 3-isopropylmalate dehydratase large subunit, partial [Puia sp.]|nr:3-isopropylmalate dehydratase large subunit [Puia sp.]